MSYSNALVNAFFGTKKSVNHVKLKTALIEVSIMHYVLMGPKKYSANWGLGKQPL